VACLHAPDGTEQTFGARATRLTGADSEAAPREAAQAACHEALMVRWSMGTTAARTAWQRLRAAGSDPPNGPLEHALHAYHRQDSLAHLLSGSTRLPLSVSRRTGTAADDPAHLAGTLADVTREDVVLVVTTAAAGLPGPGAAATVVRLVAPGARRLPTDEHAHRPPARARTLLPQSLGLLLLAISHPLLTAMYG
jgi:ribosomal protein S12 methylthiotransferase accessory factor